MFFHRIQHGTKIIKQNRRNITRNLSFISRASKDLQKRISYSDSL